MTNHELALVRRPASINVSIELIRAQKTASAAISLACQVSGLDDKEIYLPLGIDPGHWSRIKKGEAGFPPDKTRDLCQLVGNTVYPEWIAYQVGCQLVVIQSEAERRAADAEKRAEDAEAQIELLKGLLIGRAA